MMVEKLNNSLNKPRLPFLRVVLMCPGYFRDFLTFSLESSSVHKRTEFWKGKKIAPTVPRHQIQRRESRQGLFSKFLNVSTLLP